MTKNLSIEGSFLDPTPALKNFSAGVGSKKYLDSQPFIKIQWYTTPVQCFFQNDQYLISFQVILSFFL